MAPFKVEPKYEWRLTKLNESIFQLEESHVTSAKVNFMQTMQIRLASPALATITDAQHYLLYFLICYLSTLLLRSLFNKYPTKPTPQLHPPPIPPALPVIGHLHHLTTAHQAISFQNLSTKYGPLLNLRLGASRMLLVSSASMATEIFKTQDLAFADRPAFAFADELPYGNSGFFGAEYGDYWK